MEPPSYLVDHQNVESSNLAVSATVLKYSPITLDSIISMFNRIKAMPYYRNYQAASGAAHNIKNHEDALEDIFTSFGLQKAEKLPRAEIDAIIKSNDATNKLPNGSFISQPRGKNNNPDFIIKPADGIVLAVEAKSKKGHKPEYNSGGIHSDYIYVFCSDKDDATTIYKGSDIRTEEQQTLIREHTERQREEDERFNRRLRELDSNSRGVQYYTRPMITQKGKSVTNYFTHENRKRDEQRVFEYIKMKYNKVD